MKLTVLGRWGAYPEAGEATSGYLLQTDRHNLLLDCGSGILAKLLYHVRQEELDAVFISHFHHDHAADLGCLSYAVKIAMDLKKRQKPLEIYAPDKSRRFAELSFGAYTVGKAVQPGTSVNLNGLTVDFCATVHEEYNLAMRIMYQGKVLVYTGDLGPTTDIREFCRGADLMVCESSLYEHEKGFSPGHLTTEEAARLAAEAGVKSLMLTHFPHAGDIREMPAEAAKFYPGKIYLAEINKTLKL
jgi:ribonuclease BN (tRNA processing enzyme)